jgi:CheY-like chemotaxis protein
MRAPAFTMKPPDGRAMGYIGEVGILTARIMIEPASLGHFGDSIDSTGEEDNVAASIVALVDDLFFLGKIMETAKVVGVTMVKVDARRGAAAIAEAQPQTILLDLSFSKLPVIDWIRALKADPATQSIPIIGFARHTQEQLIADAKAAGCDRVMARSAFTVQLPNLLQNLVVEGGKQG